MPMVKKTISVSERTNQLLSQINNVSAYIEQTMQTAWDQTSASLKLLMQNGIESDEIRQLVQCIMHKTFPVSNQALLLEISKCKDKSLLKIDEKRISAILQAIKNNEILGLAICHLTNDYWNGNTWLKDQLTDLN